ncbi:hypothetical protein D3C76_1781820 [compost metagenome]
MCYVDLETCAYGRKILPKVRDNVYEQTVQCSKERFRSEDDFGDEDYVGQFLPVITDSFGSTAASRPQRNSTGNFT